MFLRITNRPNKEQEKTLIFPTNFPQIAMSLPEGTATSRIDNFIKM